MTDYNKELDRIFNESRKLFGLRQQYEVNRNQLNDQIRLLELELVKLDGEERLLLKLQEEQKQADDKRKNETISKTVDNILPLKKVEDGK